MVLWLSKYKKVLQSISHFYTYFGRPSFSRIIYRGVQIYVSSSKRCLRVREAWGQCSAVSDTACSSDRCVYRGHTSRWVSTQPLLPPYVCCVPFPEFSSFRKPSVSLENGSLPKHIAAKSLHSVSCVMLPPAHEARRGQGRDLSLAPRLASDGSGLSTAGPSPRIIGTTWAQESLPISVMWRWRPLILSLPF